MQTKYIVKDGLFGPKNFQIVCQCLAHGLLVCIFKRVRADLVENSKLLIKFQREKSSCMSTD